MSWWKPWEKTKAQKKTKKKRNKNTVIFRIEDYKYIDLGFYVFLRCQGCLCMVVPDDSKEHLTRCAETKKRREHEET